MDVYMARQPIFDTDNHVYGYELLYRSNGKQNEYNGLDGDASTADVVTNAFFGLNISEIIGKNKAFINFTSNLLKRGVPKMISPELVVVEVLENLMMDEQLLAACQELKERGYTLALDDFEYDNSYSQLFELGDIVKIDFRTPQKSIEETAYICRYCNKLLLAEKIETQEEFEWAKKLGCSFMQGYYFAKPTIMSRNSITPLPVNFMRVMQLVSQPEPEFSDIVDVISCDTAMCQRLLRLINSVYFGVRNRVSSIGQALVILGLDYLREWIYLMGMQRITRSDNVELMRISCLLAKFCKQLALMIPQAASRRGFLLPDGSAVHGHLRRRARPGAGARGIPPHPGDKERSDGKGRRVQRCVRPRLQLRKGGLGGGGYLRFKIWPGQLEGRRGFRAVR